ncbi:cbb3-type cytochrome oxidase assembly protein CcoS [Microbulbifer echini]|uniref:Cbb3-type cytochrome oxidase assembly protein CcoS n=1 Tax=Microbulbifer echini TaxID=1529067 RepID=A0ABV4NKU1_9GAMM|nr:cbb3-type cytochrome oxidase assembly protein CcoS [uncultured Microbulbifer sp.]
MDSLYFLIPIAVVFVALATKVFFWAVNNGQYDDLETEGRRILFEDDLQGPSSEPGEKEQ